MKKLFYFTLFFHFFFLSFVFGMEPEKPLHKKIYSMACLPNNTIALASEEGCDLITNPLSATSRIVKNVRKQPTFRLMTNGNKDKICLCGPKDCEIYAINIKTRLGSYGIASYCMMNFEYFSVVFNPIDDSLVSRQDDGLFIDGTKRYILPYVGFNDHFSIDCHPNGKEILYPSSNSTLTVRNIHGSSSYDYQLDWLIRHAFYSQNGCYIAVITDNGNLPIYEPEHNKSRMFPSASVIQDAAFLPDHNSIALVNEPGDIYFWNFITDRTLPTPITAPFNAQEISSRKRIVISPNESEFAVLIENQCFIGNIPAPFTKNKMFFVCWILQQYSQQNGGFLLRDIIHLFIKSMVALQKPSLTFVIP